MKKSLFQRCLVLLSIATCCFQNSQAQSSMKYKLLYNTCNSNYEVHMVTQSTYVLQQNKLNVATCGVGIVVPESTENGSFNITNVAAPQWIDPSQVNGYLGNDYHKVITNGAAILFPGLTSIPAGTDILLFTFTIGSPATCIPGVRLFYNQVTQNGTQGVTPCNGTPQYPDATEAFPLNPDPCSLQMPGGGDYRSAFQQLVPASNTYRGNIGNTGTFCTGFDYGDLTSLWPSAKAAMISPDCNGDGKPDGSNGAVWAGLLIDVEGTQKFSSSVNTANGDNDDGLNDEDGLVFPSGNMKPGYTYTYKVTLNSNTAGTTVYYGLWFDYNNDGAFNALDVDGNGNAAFYSGSGVAMSPVTVDVPVKTPYNASENFKTRLIVSDQPITIGMSAGTFANGEVEDYQAPPLLLPVTFGDVKAEAKNCNVYLSFDYLTQQNNKAFEIEYSSNTNSWKKLATLSNTGNTGSKSFSYVHSNPVAGANYYRIKQIDVNGNATYSNIVVANSNCDGQIKITTYPNPVKNSLTVVLPTGFGKSELRVSDAIGKVISSTSTESSFNTINTQMLASGMYLVEVISNNKTVYSRKFIKE